MEPPPLVIMRFTDERRMLKQELRLSLMTCKEAGRSKYQHRGGQKTCTNSQDLLVDPNTLEGFGWTIILLL